MNMEEHLAEKNTHLSAELALVRRERDLYKQAKDENDERFQIERDKARQELERVQKQNAAMTMAIEYVLELSWKCDIANLDTSVLRAAIQPDAVSDFIRKDAVKPLVEALRRINEISVIDDDMGCSVIWAGEALDHAKTLGL